MPAISMALGPANAYGKENGDHRNVCSWWLVSGLSGLAKIWTNHITASVCIAGIVRIPLLERLKETDVSCKYLIYLPSLSMT